MDRFAKIKKILIIVLIFNWLVAFAKIIYGLITKCASMTADGFHSFGDGASNIIGLIGIWVASKPRDESHPYGHKKFETFATLGIALILFLVAFDILKEALLRICYPVAPQVTIFSFIIMITTLIINIFVVRYEHKKSVLLQSDILASDALHTKSDILASLAVIGTLVSIRLGFVFLDTIVAGAIAVLIAKSGFEILKKTSDVLCDARVLKRSEISKIVRNLPQIKSLHKIRTRGRQDDIHVDLHVTIDAEMHVDDAHQLSHKIETILKDKIPGITDVSVHMEPSK